MRFNADFFPYKAGSKVTGVVDASCKISSTTIDLLKLSMYNNNSDSQRHYSGEKCTLKTAQRKKRLNWVCFKPSLKQQKTILVESSRIIKYAIA